MLPETDVNRPRTVCIPKKRTENPTEDRAPSMANVSGSDAAWDRSWIVDVGITATARGARPSDRALDERAESVDDDRAGHARMQCALVGIAPRAREGPRA